MRIPLRIIAPILTALVCVAGLLAFLWWQLAESSTLLQIPNLSDTSPTEHAAPTTTPLTDIASNDRTLMSLRQGDLLALNGDWPGAQEAYQTAVDLGGGLPALRKLAQAQLQRGQLEVLPQTIEALKKAGAKPEDILLLESIVHLRSGDLEAARALLSGADLSPQKHYASALLAIVESQYELAQTELNAVVNGWEPVLRSHARTILAAYDEFALFPESPPEHLNTLLARSLAQVQECAVALLLLQSVTGTRQDYRDAWIIQGYCQLTSEQPEKALASLEQAYTIDPQKAEIQYFLGRSYAALSQPENAIIFFEYALQNGFEPASEVREHIALQAIALQDFTRALQQYTTLIEDPNAPLEAYIGYSETNLLLNQNQEAYIQAKAAAQRWPEDARAQLLLGKTAAVNKQNDEARTALQTAIDLDPLLQEAAQLLEELK